MSPALVVVSLLIAQAPPSIVEFHDGVVVSGTTPRKIPVHAHLNGILGWSFDVAPSGRLVTIERTASPTTPNHADLVLRDSSSDKGTILLSEKAGLSSPLLSPNEKQVLVVRGTDELLVVDITGSVRVVGEGVAGIWDARGNIYAYERANGCHRLRALSVANPRESKNKDSALCRGETALALINGAPEKVALPVVDANGEVVGWLGADVQTAERVTLAGDQLGYACERGTDFQTRDGNWLTVRAEGASLALVKGRSCDRGLIVKSSFKALKLEAPSHR